VRTPLGLPRYVRAGLNHSFFSPHLPSSGSMASPGPGAQPDLRAEEQRRVAELQATCLANRCATMRRESRRSEMPLVSSER
jgi:hypothetical protein